MVGGERTVSCASAPVPMTDGEPAGRRSRSDLFLSPLPVPDDVPAVGPEEPATTEEETAHPAPSRFHRAGPLLLVAVALVAAVAVIGDGEDESDGQGEPPVTTTTAVPSLSTAGPAATTLERPTAGPLLPEPTGAALAVVTPSVVSIVDLDTGAVRRAAVAGQGSYETGWAAGSAVVVQSPDGVVAVPVARAEEPVVLVDRGESDWIVPSDRPGRVWLLTYVQGSLEGREVSVEGHDTGRRFRLPDTLGGERLVATNGGFVVEVFGSLTLYDPDTGEVRAAGHGIPLAASGGTLARLSCEALRCGLHLTDLGTDGDVEVPLPVGADVMPYAGAAFSPDGRWLALGVGLAAGGPDGVALVDVARGRIVAVHPNDRGGATTFAFSPDSRWLFAVVGVHDVVAPTAGHRRGGDPRRPPASGCGRPGRRRPARVTGAPVSGRWAPADRAGGRGGAGRRRPHAPVRCGGSGRTAGRRRRRWPARRRRCPAARRRTARAAAA